MWVLELNLDSSKQFLGNMAIKHNVSIVGRPLSYYKKGGEIYLVCSGIILGEEKNKKAFIKDLKKQKEIVNLEFTKDFGLIVLKQPGYTEPLYNSQVIYLSPIIINPHQKKHVWHLGSFNRKVLEEILSFTEKHLDAKLIKFKQEKISNISFTKLMPELTNKQKKALEIAIGHGYYDYPKKIKMEELAKLMKISYSTYQAHLKKAEGKILPEVYKELK